MRRLPHFSLKPRIPEAAQLCVLMMMVHMCLTGSRVSLTLSAIKQLQMNTLEVGILIAFFALLPMMLSVKAGRLIDVIGPYKPMRTAALSAGIGALLPVFWLHWSTLGLAAICIGVGHMAFQISTQGQLGAGNAKQRLRNFSWLSLTLAVSGFSGPLIAGLAIDNIGYTWAFGLLALFPLTSAMFVIRIRQRLLDAHIPKPTTQQKHKVADLLRIIPLRNALMANLMLAGAWDTHQFLIPIYGAQRALTATTIGTILAAFALATFLIRTALPLIQKHFQPWTLIHFAMITAGLNFFLYPLFTDVWVLASMSFVLGLSLGCTQPSILSLLQQHAPEGRKSEVFGVRMALINGSQVSLPLAFGALGSLLGVTPLFWATAVMVTSGAWFTRHAGRHETSPPQSEVIMESSTPDLKSTPTSQTVAPENKAKS
ncbi:MFS transporter [Orrella sp. 11846]|uniref:MFS transporter n=1 Tax=Orrella sp. 11846 TaxID=3409913 RepID=UPI003B5B95C5